LLEVFRSAVGEMVREGVGLRKGKGRGRKISVIVRVG
jgi:hypothetical protein